MSEALNLNRLAFDPRFLLSKTDLRHLAIESLVGGLATGSTVLARVVIESLVGGIAPFVLTFPAVMIATLVSGGRAGTIAAFSCQMLTIRYVFPNWISPHGGLPIDLANIILSTIALAGTVWATASYRRTAAMLRSQCQHQVHTLSLLISEMDHRTKNNFQIAAGLLGHQSISAANPELTRELDKAASRLETIASVYQDLSPSVVEQRVDLSGHVGRIVTLLRTGAVPNHITLSFHGEHVEVANEAAIITGLIVNEWITNALKHAFGNEPGGIAVSVTQRRERIDVIVRDDGNEGESPKVESNGSDLMRSLAEVIKADISIKSDRGTRCALTIPTKGS